MTKYKCDVCGEKHDKMFIYFECSKCYIHGIAEELKKVLEEYLIKRKDIKSVNNEPTTEDKIREEIDEDYASGHAKGTKENGTK